MEGCLKYLVSGTEEAISLLHRYIFKIVPMVNVDGVIYGNSRCDINGCDVNRQWSNPNRYFLPIVFNIKSTFEKMIAEGYEIDYFLDLHGHSKKYNLLNVDSTALSMPVMTSPKASQAGCSHIYSAKYNPNFHMKSVCSS